MSYHIGGMRSGIPGMAILLGLGVFTLPKQGYAAAPVLTTLYTFAGPPNDGWGAQAGLVMRDGVLYGVTEYGGNALGRAPYNCNNGCGTVFALYPPSTPGGPWTEKVIHNFQGGLVEGGGDGANPTSGVIFDEEGVLYGTTSAGGAGNSGTVYQMRPAAEPGGVWTERVIYNIGYTIWTNLMPVRC